jgi:23S rRNA (uracil1939-C5)-methyltransferase
VVDLPACEVLDPGLKEVAAQLRRGLVDAALDGVDLARIDDQLMVTLIAGEHASRAQVEALALQLREAQPAVTSVAMARRQADAVQLLGGEIESLWGPRELRVSTPAKGTYYYATHGAFQQVNADTASEITARVVERVRGAVGGRGTARVLELYAGSGALSLALAAQGMSVVAVEAFGPACDRLARAAHEQRLAVNVHAGDAGVIAEQLAREGARFDAVIVNPPRRGLDLAVRQALADLAPEHVAYVSCNPATLARDLAHLAREGLSADQLEPFDMMPLTDHVETLAWLSRGTSPQPEILFSEGPLLAVNKAPHEPTNPQNEHARSLLARVQELPGFERAVPLHRLDVGTSGVCLFSATPEQAGALAAALSGADKTYVTLAKGVTHKKGRIQRPIIEAGRKLEASTRFERTEVVRGHSLLRVLIETGRKHQIRKHLLSIGHPVIGDSRYGDRGTQLHFSMRHGLDRPFLHCASMRFTLEGKLVEVNAPLAADLALVLASLRA